jgi:hypothetical protein
MILLMTFLTLLFWHALADFPLQGELSRMKRPDGGYTWQIALFWHAFIHAGGVLAITGNIYAALFELLSHGTIDYFKCRGKFDNWTDQLLHVATKLVILLVLRVRFV